MTKEKPLNAAHVFLGIALFVMTIIFAQQIINVMFSDENSIRVIAKLIIDTSLIVIGLGVHHRIVGNVILYAGIVRFFFVFFQLSGMDPTLRVVVIIMVLLVLFVVGFIKFGKNLTSHPKEAK